MKGIKGSETKRLIREAAYKQFLTKDYNTVPLKEIEKSLNLSRGCMSYHYPSKQELFIDVIDYYVFHKQDTKNKFKDIPSCSLLEFIDYYIKSRGNNECNEDLSYQRRKNEYYTRIS